MATTRTERVAGPGGESFDAHVALPEGGSGSGVLLLHEIFGVNDYVRDVAQRLAGLGHVVLAPDLFWRQGPGHELNTSDEESLGRGVETATGWFADVPSGLADLGAALAHLRALPEVTGRVAVLGFCFGGTLTYLAAANLSVDAAVSYYGSGLPDQIPLLDEIRAPLLVHFGGDDPFIERGGIDRFAAAAEAHANVTVVVHEGGGHAFDNSFTPFSQPEHAARAWTMTTELLARTLG